jgi:hypothetical protein
VELRHVAEKSGEGNLAFSPSFRDIAALLATDPG